MKHIAEQFQLPFPRERVTVNVGKIDPRFFTLRDAGKLCRPRSEGACDAFERDLGLLESEWEDSDEF
jgi:hypothetical protein